MKSIRFNLSTAATLFIAAAFPFAALTSHAQAPQSRPNLNTQPPAAALPQADSVAGKEQLIATSLIMTGAFGGHIALGIRIGEDALHRLNLPRRQVVVTVTEGANAPCACIVDGVSVATASSLGQKSLSLTQKSSDPSFLAVVEVKAKNDQRKITYVVPASAIARLSKLNQTKSPPEILDEVLAIPEAEMFTARRS